MASVGEPVVVVQAADEHRHPGRAERAPELVVGSARDGDGADEARAHGEVRDHEAARGGSCRRRRTGRPRRLAPWASRRRRSGTRRRGTDPLERAVPEEVLVRASVRRRRSLDQGHRAEVRVVDPAGVGRKVGRAHRPDDAVVERDRRDRDRAGDDERCGHGDVGEARAESRRRGDARHGSCDERHDQRAVSDPNSLLEPEDAEQERRVLLEVADRVRRQRHAHRST